MEKVKSWWSGDRKWFCLLVNSGVDTATVSLTSEEAAELSEKAKRPPRECDCGAETEGKWADKHASGCASLYRSESSTVALWMMGHGYATGHGDTIEDMLTELEAQAKQRAFTSAP